MKPTLQLKLSQHLALTPQLQQSIRLLQLSTIELDQELEKFLAENPMLEREDEHDTSAEERAAPEREAGEGVASGEMEERRSEHAATNVDEAAASDDNYNDASYEDRWAYDSGGARSDDDDDTDTVQIQAATTSLRDHLTWQLSLTALSTRDRALVGFLIEGLNEDGYLTSNLPELVSLLPPELDIEEDELAVALRQLQSFDPTGVGARDCRECLTLQLKALSTEAPGREVAMRLVDRHLELLAARDFTRLRRVLACSEAQLKQAHQLILTLNPRPGAPFASVETRYITPDVVVRKVRSHWVASVNQDAMPRLRINRLYADILRRNRGASSGLSAQLQEARWMIRNVQQRFETIQKVSQAIVDRQRAFFEHGEIAMKPLVLREIADLVGLHESTISRVTTQKYMATPRGIFELKYFFGSHVSTDSGGACSSTAIRALIKQFVGAENPKKPLSDSRIADLLGEQGIVVARRTIAKYRDALNIPPVSQRKSL